MNTPVYNKEENFWTELNNTACQVEAKVLTAMARVVDYRRTGPQELTITEATESEV